MALSLEGVRCVHGEAGASVTRGASLYLPPKAALALIILANLSASDGSKSRSATSFLAEIPRPKKKKREGSGVVSDEEGNVTFGYKAVWRMHLQHFILLICCLR